MCLLLWFGLMVVRDVVITCLLDFGLFVLVIDCGLGFIGSLVNGIIITACLIACLLF